MGLYLPDGIGVFAGLAVEEAQLLQRLGEGIFARHDFAQPVDRSIQQMIC